MIDSVPLVLGAIVALWSVVTVCAVALCRMSADAEAAESFAGSGSEALAAEYVPDRAPHDLHVAPEGPVRHV